MKTIKNIFLDFLIETNIMEMTFSRSVLLSDIRNKRQVIHKHLFYIFAYPNSSSINHWKMEITGWLSELGDTTLKPNNKKLDYKSYYDTFTSDFDSIGEEYVLNIAKNTIKKEGKFENYTLNDLPLEEIVKRYKTFYSKISKYFSESKFIDEDVVKEMINNF
jgi:hypothetical protein